jgi:LysR family transcriptional regulator (chromosome initiation inhibitor)
MMKRNFTLDLVALRALSTVLRLGSFEQAARALHVTPSAVSQRVKALEERLGCVLLVRAAPVTATPEGARLYRHYLQVEMLEADLRDDLQPQGEGTTASASRSIPVAVNADSLATWVIPAMVDFHACSGGDTLALHVDDQDHTREWLKNGTVFGAVTAAAEPVGGCRVDALGAMPYVAAVSPVFADRHFADGLTAEAFRRAPMLVYNQKDQMQHRFLSEVIGEDCTPPQWWVPSAQGFLDAAIAGLGWGLHPVPLAAAALQAGMLVDLCPGRRVSVALYWQSWRLDSASVRTLRDCIWRAASAVLDPSGQ